MIGRAWGGLEPGAVFLGAHISRRQVVLRPGKGRASMCGDHPESSCATPVNHWSRRGADACAVGVRFSREVLFLDGDTRVSNPEYGRK